MGQSVSLSVSAYFINPCAELCVVFLRFRVPFKSVKEFLHTLVLKCRTEIYGEQLSFLYSTRNAPVADTLIPQILLHQLLACHSHFIFIKAASGVCFYETITKGTDQFRHNRLTVCPRSVHFIDKHKHRGAVSGQQLP